MRRFVLALVTGGACAEVEEARLDHAQILAVRLDPPQVAPGGRTRLDLLAGDDHGNVFEVAPSGLDAGDLVVERTAEGWFITAPLAPGSVSLAVTLELDGTTWPASKQLVVGEPGTNPRVDAMQIDGERAGDSLVVRRGSKPRLAVATPIEGLRHAWYSSVGDLALYRQPEAVLDAATAADGLVVLVVRDDRGGVGWHVVPTRVE